MQKNSDVEAIGNFLGKYNELKSEIAKIIVGQEEIIKNMLISIFSRGHCLLVGVPGLAKTMMVTTLAKVLGLSFNRIQFTPDLMPSDIIGTEILDEHRKFKFVKGPLFANIILADEINRTPPKTQSALLEAMQEKEVTASGTTYHLGDPFFVLATQNPIEQEGTYPLPEAQLDRFMFNVWLDYTSYEDEIKIVKQTTTDTTAELKEVLTSDEIVFYQKLVRKIPVPDNVYEYAVSLAISTRPGNPKAHKLANEYISWGAGPRASQYLIIGAKCNAILDGKYSPDIEDIKAVATPILRHRLVKNFKAEAEGISIEEIINEMVRAF